MEAEKQSIRNNQRRLRRGLLPEEVVRLSHRVCSHAQGLPHFQQASSVGLYLSVDNEVDPTLLLRAATLSQKTIFLPIVDKERKSLIFSPYQEGDRLTLTALGIREPLLSSRKDGHEVDAIFCTASIDVLFLPLVAFDSCGHRLGYGGGYYDRYLSRDNRLKPSENAKKPHLVGLAYSFQEVPALPFASHDIPLEWVVTEQGSWRCGNI